jgi:hypothetical protein
VDFPAKIAGFDDGTPSIQPSFPFRKITAGSLGRLQAEANVNRLPA